MTDEEALRAEAEAKDRATRARVDAQNINRIGAGWKLSGFRLVSSAEAEEGVVVHFTADEQKQITDLALQLLKMRSRA